MAYVMLHGRQLADIDRFNRILKSFRNDCANIEAKNKMKLIDYIRLSISGVSGKARVHVVMVGGGEQCVGLQG